MVKPQSLLAWQRVHVANMMAHSGQEWYSAVRKYNSGIHAALHVNGVAWWQNGHGVGLAIIKLRVRIPAFDPMPGNGNVMAACGKCRVVILSSNPE